MHSLVFGAKDGDSVFGLFSNAIDSALKSSGVQSEVMNLNLGSEDLLSYKEYLENKEDHFWIENYLERNQITPEVKKAF